MSTRPAPTLGHRVAARLGARGRVAEGDRVVVAVSGGLDSLVLLHLLRFAPELPSMELVAAHFDHRMREGSGADADWVAGLARAWQVPLERGAAARPPVSEASARDARYAFLEQVKARVAGRWILTAHHADDQAETVLFRLARGSGIAGLRGIPARRGALLRPLLSVWRTKLEGYARAQGITPRDDPTNRESRFARNLLRHEVVPRLAAVAPGVRRALVRLARTAAREERAWRSVLPSLAAPALVDREQGRIVLARDVLLEWPAALRARVLRSFVHSLGGRLDEAGTLALIEFTKLGASGRGRPLPGGVTVVREFDRIVLARGGTAEDDQSLEITAAGSGEGRLKVGGRRLIARWSVAAHAPDESRDPARQEMVSFPLERLVFPLHLRGWRPGDRIRLPYGSKKLKKLLGEARVPASERGRVAVLVDARDRVVWVAGIARETGTQPVPGEDCLQIGIEDDGRARP